MSDVGRTRPVVSAARSGDTRRVGDRERESQCGQTHPFLHGGSWMPPPPASGGRGRCTLREVSSQDECHAKSRDLPSDCYANGSLLLPGLDVVCTELSGRRYALLENLL